MSEAHKLLDKQFMLGYLRAKTLPLYPQYKSLDNIEIIAHKEYIWPGYAYHVVIEYNTVFKNAKSKETTLPIFCSAHWTEPRINVYTSLKYLWNNGFNKADLAIPHPLFYSRQFRGIFYEGIRGYNLYRFIRKSNKKEIKKMIPKTAKWFAKLHHQTPILAAKNFNKQNSRIKTVIPGVKHIFSDIEERYPEYLDFYKKLYDIFIKKEEKFLKNTNRLYLVHGDAHPENIIKIDNHKIGVIDFTDLCLSDYARDLGSFTQQLYYMCHRKISDLAFADKMCELFLKKYAKYAKIKIDDNLQERIKNYYDWTMLRTATFFLTKHDPKPERGKDLIEKLKKIY
jgi:thiamine kinase-like enzyme